MVLPFGGRVGRRQLNTNQAIAPGIFLPRGFLVLAFSLSTQMLMQTLSSRQLILVELLWWLFTALLATLILLPIYLKVPNYPFWKMNLLYLVTFVTCTRFIFLLRFTFLANRFWWKFALIFLSIPFVFFLIQGLNTFQTFLDEQGVEAVAGLLPLQQQDAMLNYIYNEFLLFAVGAIISAVVFPFRLAVSIWRVRNRNQA